MIWVALAGPAMNLAPGGRVGFGVEVVSRPVLVGRPPY